ncbi:MAG TPA: LacI family DNA-binding transcriptional regulator, partial [Agromyces sp.]
MQGANGSGARPSAPTLEMVAREANVSRATVSRVVNGSPKVSPEVVRVVNEAIAKLNYVPNRAARSLASRTSGAIALVVPEDTTRFFGDPYFAAIVQGITRRLDVSEYLLNLLLSTSDPNRKTLRYLRSGVVDGALVVSHHEGDHSLHEAAHEM